MTNHCKRRIVKLTIKRQKNLLAYIFFALHSVDVWKIKCQSIIYTRLQLTHVTEKVECKGANK